MTSEIDTRLSQIQTHWTLVRQAHAESVSSATPARQELMERYLGAAYRYLFAMLKDPDETDELFQEFALRFIRGDFHQADPGKGRFRKYVKSVLMNLVFAYRRKGRPRGAKLCELRWEPEVEARGADTSEQVFDDSWQQELLSRTWQALAAHESHHGQPFHTVLQYRSDHPDATAEQMADQLSSRLRPDQPWSPAAMRKLLQRARERFAELLLDEVARSLEGAPFDRVEEELAELKLLAYCRPAVESRRRDTESGNGPH